MKTDGFKLCGFRGFGEGTNFRITGDKEIGDGPLRQGDGEPLSFGSFDNGKADQRFALSADGTQET